MAKSLTIGLSLFFVTTNLFSQQRIDSLWTQFNHSKTDTTKISILLHLFDAYEYDSVAKASQVLQQALAIAKRSTPMYKVKTFERLGNFQVKKSEFDSAFATFQKMQAIAEENALDFYYAESLNGLGNCLFKKGNYPRSKEYFDAALLFSKDKDLKFSLAGANNNLGRWHSERGELAQAMEYYTAASQLFNEIGSKAQYGSTLSNIGVILRMTGKNEEAKNYFIRSEALHRSIDNHSSRAFALNNLSIVSKNLKQYDKAIEYSQESLEIFERLGDRQQMSSVHYGMGNLFWMMDDLNGALAQYKLSNKIASEIGDSTYLAYSQTALGQCNLELKNYKQAEIEIKKGLSICQALSLTPLLMDNYQALSNLYVSKGDFKNAFDTQTKYIQFNDSIYTLEKRDLALEIEAKYQNEEKAKEIELLESQNSLKSLQIQNERNLMIIGSLVLLLAIGLVYYQYRLKRKANDDLKKLDQLKSDFFANISHEFRTPLSLIMAPLKQRIDMGSDSANREDDEMMYRNAEQLYHLIDQLLNLSKLEEGGISLTKSTLHVEDFFKVMAASFTSLADYKEIKFLYHIQNGQHFIAADQDVVQKVCYNLLSNAFKFTPEGGRIDFNIQAKESWLHIEVTDNGEGISKEDQSKVFDRFFQSSAARTVGTGIGLALTKELINFHGGNIEVESEIGKGSTFRVKIPVEFKENLEENVVNVKPLNVFKDVNNLDEMGTSKGAPVILIIEDNADVRNYVAKLLKDDFSIFQSINGEEGIQKAKEIVPDLIISDVMMPGKDGLQVCKELKGAVETDHIPIILLTARADQESKLGGLIKGADDYLLKPFDPIELKVRVSNLLKQRAKLKEKYARLLSLHPREIVIVSQDELFLKKAMEIVDKNLDDSDFTAEKFSVEMGMSRMQLHRKLTSLTDHSATAFVRHQRLIRAKQFLESGENVSQVAFMVGFGTPSYFTRAFKEEFGITPSQYQSEVSSR